MAVPTAVRPHRLTVRVTPKGGRDAVDGWTTDDAGRPILKLRVTAAASEGAANAAVTILIAKALKVPKSAVRIAAGETSRIKRLEIAGATAADVEAAFGPEPSPGVGC
jgi:uncharacterized protein